MKFKILVWIIINLLISSCASFFSAKNNPSQKLKEISFSEDAPNQDYHFYYSDTLNQSYLRKLRQDYNIGKLASTKNKEIEKIKVILNWCNSQWKHNGSNTPSNSDALTILKEVENGSQFRCVEYGILTAASLNSIGIKSRVLNLKTRDVEKVKRNAGHVVTEAFSRQYNKWIFIDPQFNIMATIKGTPLNAIEFQKAIMTNKEAIELVNIKGNVDKELLESYINWIGKYLYYFDVLFDQRVGMAIDYKNFKGKTCLMLVPKGVDNPLIFQRNSKINYCIYTNSIKDFYRKPSN